MLDFGGCCAFKEVEADVLPQDKSRIGDNRNVRVGQFAVDDMKVGTANTTGTHPNPYLARPWLPVG